METTPIAPPARTIPITVREAVPAEYDEVGRLMVEAYRQYQPVFPSEFWDGYNDDLRDVARRAEQGVILVADEAGAVAGALALYPPGDPNGHWPHDWVGDLATNGLILPLYPKSATKKQFPSYALDAFSYGTAVKKLYGAPYGLENVGLVVNTKLAKVPTSFSCWPWPR